MPANPTTQQMGDRHEKHLAGVFGGTKTRASGSQWHDQGDVRNGHDEPFAFMVDGKSTRAKSLTVTLDMIARLREQAQGERPAFGLRWYGSDDLRVILEDWALIPTADLEEILPAARQMTELEARYGNVEELIGQLKETVQRRAEQIEHLSGLIQKAAVLADPAGDESRQVPGYVPQLPWTVIHLAHREEPVKSDLAVLHFGEDGRQRLLPAREARVERSASGRPRIFTDDVLCAPCDVYADGLLIARSWSEHPEKEIG